MRKFYISLEKRECMAPETVTILKEEYQRLKALEKVEWKVVGEFKEALNDLKSGKFIEC